LDLEEVEVYEIEARKITAAFAGLLKQLPNLQQLRLHGSSSIRWSAVQHITAMQGLADLDLRLWDSSELDIRGCPSTVPQTLTRLVTAVGNGGPHLAQPQPFPSFLASLEQLQQLLMLEVRCAVFDPAQLTSLTHLQRLCLEQCGLLPFEAGAEKSAQGTIALLGALDSLPNLKHLSLGKGCLDTEQDHTRFASLAASSKLTSLKLVTDTYQPLPRRAASCIFSRPLPQLQQLCISVVPKLSDYYDDWDEKCISKADLRCIVRSCPSLQQLDLRCTVTPGQDVSALQELQACRVLIVGGRGFEGQQAEVIGQLTWLTELQWYGSPALTDFGLQQLTTLTNLGRLWVHGCSGLSQQVMSEHDFKFGHSLEIPSRHDKVRCLTL
jgi:hypothetical protein